MTDRETYQAAVFVAIAAARALAVQPIPELLSDIDRADAFGPIINPTLWRDKHKAMDQDRKLLEAALPLYRIGVKLNNEEEE